jgi:hypothetical protein
MTSVFAAARRVAVLAMVALLSLGVFATRAAAVEVEILPDLVYGHKDGLAMTLDVLKPKSGANGAAILYMVSGGWVSRWAPPKESAERFQFLLEKGYTMVIVRHGSSPRYQVPDAVDDVRRDLGQRPLAPPEVAGFCFRPTVGLYDEHPASALIALPGGVAFMSDRLARSGVSYYGRRLGPSEGRAHRLSPCQTTPSQQEADHHHRDTDRSG